GAPGLRSSGAPGLRGSEADEKKLWSTGAERKKAGCASKSRRTPPLSSAPEPRSQEPRSPGANFSSRAPELQSPRTSVRRRLHLRPRILHVPVQPRGPARAQVEDRFLGRGAVVLVRVVVERGGLAESVQHVEQSARM